MMVQSCLKNFYPWEISWLIIVASIEKAWNWWVAVIALESGFRGHLVSAIINCAIVWFLWNLGATRYELNISFLYSNKTLFYLRTLQACQSCRFHWWYLLFHKICCNFYLLPLVTPSCFINVKAKNHSQVIPTCY